MTRECYEWYLYNTWLRNDLLNATSTRARLFTVQNERNLASKVSQNACSLHLIDWYLFLTLKLSHYETLHMQCSKKFCSSSQDNRCRNITARSICWYRSMQSVTCDVKSKDRKIEQCNKTSIETQPGLNDYPANIVRRIRCDEDIFVCMLHLDDP